MENVRLGRGGEKASGFFQTSILLLYAKRKNRHIFSLKKLRVRCFGTNTKLYRQLQLVGAKVSSN